MTQKVLEVLAHLPANNSRYRLAVNVSGHSIAERAHLRELKSLLARYPSRKGRLLFEVTESARIHGPDRADTAMQDLRRQGYQICLDDFGAGAD